MYQEMTMNDIWPGKEHLQGRRYKEKIYLDKDNLEIRFASVEADEIHVNRFDQNAKVLEYYLANKKGERQYLDALQE